MRILFCGISVPEKIEYQVEQISAAGNRFQNNMIQNLRTLGHEVIVLSYIAMPIPKEMQDELCDTECQKYVIRKNSGIKSTLEAVRTCREKVKKLLATCDMVISYNVFYSFLFLPIVARHAQKKSVLILADYSGKECYTNIKGRAYATLQQRTIRKYDTVVGLSANIQNGLTPQQEFVLMEGGIDQAFFDSFSFNERENNSVVRFMYSGLLSKVTGVDILLDAMKQLADEEIELWISGKGDLESLVKTVAERDHRIKYLGHMEYSEYKKHLGQADVLVNPRNMSLPENQNNFPSKIMEYLAVGKPIVSSKFIGWEKFRNEICFYDDDVTSVLIEISNKMKKQEVCFEDVYEENRKRAREYLWIEQLRRII